MTGEDRQREELKIKELQRKQAEYREKPNVRMVRFTDKLFR